MKKTIIITLLALVSTMVSAAPPFGCYEGSGRLTRGRCAIQIGGNVLNIIDKEGNVRARWNIVKETMVEEGKFLLTLESPYGATQTASWWREDGRTYLNFSYDTYTLME